MRFDIGLGFFKGSLSKAAKNLLPKNAVTPASAPPTVNQSFSPLRPSPVTEAVKLVKGQVDDVKDTTPPGPFEIPDSRADTLDKHTVHQAYNRVLRRVFSRLDDHQRSFFAKLFPAVNEKNRKYREIRALKMKSYIQFLTTPTADTPGTCLLLHFDDKRYLVGNVHEGLQRAGIQFGAKFTKVQDIFVTGRTEWKTTGGLLGMVLTLADSTNASSAALVNEAKRKLENERRRLNDQAPAPPIPSAAAITAAKAALNIHGGPNLTHLFATARMFVFRKGVPLEVHEDDSNGQAPADLDRKPDWADENIQVWNMAITPSDYVSSSKSPRKRSFTEFSESETSEQPVHNGEVSSSPLTDQEVRRHVVAEIFHSNWHLDNLVEVPLSSIDGPATLFLRDTNSNKLRRYYPPLLDSNTPLVDINVLVRKKWPGAEFADLPRSKPSPIAMSYILRNHRQRGKFIPAKAKDLKVKKGPLWAQLSAGISVQSEDGKTITPDMVLAEGKEGGGIAVVDLPDKDYVECLINRPEWKSQAIMTGVGGIVWLLGTGVGQDTRVQTFMNNHPQWKHIISSPDSCPNYLAMSSSANSAIRLSQINKHIFPIPVYDNNVPFQRGGEISQVLTIPEGVAGTDGSSVKAVPAQQGLMCQLEPTFEVQGKAIVPFLDTASTIKCVSNNVLNLAQTAREEVALDAAGHTQNEELPSGDAEIITLGTGSALPSKYRNVSSTLLRVPGSGSYLLDCGENTLGQLRRVYGEAGLRDVLRDLKLIWISHLHADHHLGTVSVIKAWRDEVHGQRQRKEEVVDSSTGLKNNSPLSAIAETSNPVSVLEDGKHLFVTGTGQMMSWLKEYADVEDYGYDTIIPLENDALKAATGLADLEACQVPHCWNAQAVSLTFPTGFKFSYSGDCRPSQNFVKIGQGSTVLLHEATFDDELQGDAEAKKHSTTSEAIGVGLAMGARRVILTHFSQRYQKIPIMDKLGLKHIRLETAEENAESNIPIGPEADSLPTPEDVVMQDTGVEEEPARSSEPADFKQAGERSSEAQVEATDSIGIRMGRSTSRAHSRYDSQSESEVIIVPEAAKRMKVCVAFDYMRIKVKEIAHMEKFTPALLELYHQDEEADKAATIQQEPGIIKKEKKRKDESDDESSKGHKKKSNEEINRGKSNRQVRNQERETNQPEKEQEGKHNAGVGDTATMDSSLGLLPLKNQHQWELADIFPEREEEWSKKRYRRISNHLAILEQRTKKNYHLLLDSYERIILSIAFTTLAISGKFEEFCKVIGPLTQLFFRRRLHAREIGKYPNSVKQLKLLAKASTPWESMQGRRLKTASRKSRIALIGQSSVRKEFINNVFTMYRDTSPIVETRTVQASLISPSSKHPMWDIVGEVEQHSEEQSPAPVRGKFVSSGARIRIGNGPNRRIIYTDNIKSLSPVNETAPAMSTVPTESEKKRHIKSPSPSNEVAATMLTSFTESVLKRRYPPTEKPRGKARFPVAAFPSTPRIKIRRARRARARLQPDWDLTLQSVANDVEGDLRNARYTASQRV